MANRGGEDSISEWFRQIPLVTKIFAFGTLLSGFLYHFRILPGVSFHNNKHYIIIIIIIIIIIN